MSISAFTLKVRRDSSETDQRLVIIYSNMNAFKLKVTIIDKLRELALELLERHMYEHEPFCQSSNYLELASPRLCVNNEDSSFTFSTMSSTPDRRDDTSLARLTATCDIALGTS